MSRSSKNVLGYLTVEPAYLFSTLVYEMMRGINMNLYLQKSCRFNQTIEPDLNTKCDDEEKGILYVSDITSKYYLVNYLLTSVFAIFATFWSDAAGRRRRPLIFLPILSQITQTISSLLQSYFWYWKPIVAIRLEVLFEVMTGGTALMVIACQMYLCDISCPEDRTMRVGFIGAIKIVSLLVGTGGSGFVLRSLGFFYSYLLCFALSVASLVLGVVFIKDISIPITKKEPFYRVFMKCLSDSFKAVFKKSLGRRRIIVVMLLVANAVANFTIFGEIAVLYLYLRHKFEWNEETYSSYMFYRFTGSTIGALLASIVLSKRLKMHDGLIGVLAGFWDTIAVIVLLLANRSWQIYAIPFLDIFHGVVLTVNTSFASKYFDSSELGRLNAVNGVFILISPFCFPVYNGIFQSTFNTYPSAFCFISIVLDVCLILLYWFSYLIDKRLRNQKPSVTELRTILS